jgi:hypothetical protein
MLQVLLMSWPAAVCDDVLLLPAAGGHGDSLHQDLHHGPPHHPEGKDSNGYNADAAKKRIAPALLTLFCSALTFLFFILKGILL